MAFDPTSPRKGFSTAASKFFGRKEGQSLGDFAAELKELTDADVTQLHAGLADGSLTY